MKFHGIINLELSKTVYKKNKNKIGVKTEASGVDTVRYEKLKWF